MNTYRKVIASREGMAFLPPFLGRAWHHSLSVPLAARRLAERLQRTGEETAAVLTVKTPSDQGKNHLDGPTLTKLQDMPPRQGNLARGRSSATFLLGACASAVVLYTCFTTSPGGSLRRESGRLQSYVALKDGKGEDVKERKLGTFWDPSEVTFKPYEVPERRADIGKLLELEKMEVGAELGVQTGLFANITLTNWKSCKKYVMIDLWRRIPGNYVDHGNADDGIQSYNYWRTRETTAHFKDRVQLMYLPMFTIEAADLFPDEHFDYVYVDARHDKCGVTEDLNKWWPKLKQGGFFAGHDMVFAHEVNGQDWSLCEDGTRDPGAVKGAVMEFALKHELKFETIYGGEQPSWILRKPVLRSVQG